MKRKRWKYAAVAAAALVVCLWLGATVLWSRSFCHRPTSKGARTSAMELRRAAETWRGGHASDQCPTPALLRQEGAIDPASKITDVWDHPFLIACEPEETIVTSAGPDGVLGTPDDIKVPG